MHTSVVTHHQRNVELAERLGRHCPCLDDPQVFFCNTGAEAVDGAIKLARQVTGRPGIIAFRGGFHGRTMGATSLTTAKGKYRAGYEPLLGGVTIAPYAYPLALRRRRRRRPAAALAALDELLTLQTPARHGRGDDRRAGAGRGRLRAGTRGLAAGPARAVRRRTASCSCSTRCRAGSAAPARCSRPTRIGVAPDVVLFAKGIASGLPLGGLIAARATFERWPPGTHGSTFGGNPVRCAAALATLDVIEDERPAASGPASSATASSSASARPSRRVLPACSRSAASG